jgi:hypothetical protein
MKAGTAELYFNQGLAFEQCTEVVWPGVRADEAVGQQAGRWQRAAAAQQQIPTVPEQAPVGWPLGPRAAQPYPTAAATVGQVVQAFRGMSMQVRRRA